MNQRLCLAVVAILSSLSLAACTSLPTSSSPSPFDVDAPNAQPVDSRRAVDMKLVLKQGAGIDLNGNLGICRYVEIPVQSLHDIPDKTRFHNRRSASSNEHGLDLVFTAAGTLDFYFPD